MIQKSIKLIIFLETIKNYNVQLNRYSSGGPGKKIGEKLAEKASENLSKPSSSSHLPNITTGKMPTSPSNLKEKPSMAKENNRKVLERTGTKTPKVIENRIPREKEKEDKEDKTKIKELLKYNDNEKKNSNFKDRVIQDNLESIIMINKNQEPLKPIPLPPPPPAASSPYYKFFKRNKKRESEPITNDLLKKTKENIALKKIFEDLQKLMEKEQKTQSDILKIKTIHKEIKDYFQKNKKVEDFENIFYKNAKNYIDKMKETISKEKFITKDEKEFNRIYSDNENLTNSDMKLKSLLKEEIQRRIPKMANLIEKEDFEKKIEHYKKYQKLLDESKDLSDKGLIELARKIKLIKYEEAIDVFKIKDLGGIKMNQKFDNDLVKEGNMFNSTKSMIMEQIEKGKIIGGILKIKSNKTLILSGEQKHMIICVEDKENSENIIIIGMLTSEKGTNIELTKTQPLNINEDEGKNKSQMLSITKRLIRISKKDIEERENVVDYIKNYKEKEDNECVFEKFKKSIEKESVIFSTKEIQNGIIEINRDVLLEKLIIGMNKYIENIEEVQESYKKKMASFNTAEEKIEYLNRKKAKVKKDEENENLSKENKYIDEILLESKNRQDNEIKLQNYLEKKNKSTENNYNNDEN